jgi:hypothetical protein
MVDKNTGNKKTSTPNDRNTISHRILIDKQAKAQSPLGKWYWQIRIDRLKNKNRAREI